ncbi:alpha/beta hydrolase family protein [Thalassoroseus pseudoceratinae]|uniref:alpha/beta hydrolase family protein n=1 Tax=Thalassoroseus pseudoceratinae TaxID=2713176 RepID=UPI0014201A80|nr:prolyl oligopeptidase family serine peptidase [Thalassoroseus pseudoceratinae]
MRLTNIAVTVLCLSASHVGLAQMPEALHSDLNWYRGPNAEIRPIQSLDDWQSRRQSILKAFQKVTGPLPDRSQFPPLDVKVTSSVETDDFVRQTISYVADANGRVTAHLYLPKNIKSNEKRSGILALHPTGTAGKLIVAGEANRPNRQYAAELASRGHVVLAPDYPPFGDLVGYDFTADGYKSGTLKGLVNHIRGVDLLVARPEVDSEKLAVIGHSLGGHNAIFVGMFDQRLKAIVSSCGWTPFHDYYGGKIAGWTSDRYMPALRTEYDLNPDRVPFDFYELCAALAPRGFFSSSPLADSNFDFRGVKKAEPKIRAVFERHKVSDRLQIVYPDCQHDFPPEIRQAAYEFIERILDDNSES